MARSDAPFAPIEIEVNDAPYPESLWHWAEKVKFHGRTRLWVLADVAALSVALDFVPLFVLAAAGVLVVLLGAAWRSINSSQVVGAGSCYDTISGLGGGEIGTLWRNSLSAFGTL